MNIKYSYVIPTYNNKDNLRLSLIGLESLELIDNVGYEVIVVDDGSDEPLDDLIMEFSDLISIRLIRLDRSTLSCRARARNFGWKESVGEYVVFIDSDIIVQPTHLIELNRFFVEVSNVLVIGNRIHADTDYVKQYFDNNQKIISIEGLNYKNLDYRYLVFSAQSYNAFTHNDSWMHAYSCNVAVKRTHLVTCAGFDESFLSWGLEDIDLAYRLYTMGISTVINPYLEVLHQSTYQRDDFAISQNRMDEYYKNIDYFSKKHSELTSGYSDIFNLLVVGKNYLSNIQCCDIKIDILSSNDVEKYKSVIVDYITDESVFIAIYDYLENSGLDLWIQSFGYKFKNVFYYPKSKCVSVSAMTKFINDVRVDVWKDGDVCEEVMVIEEELNFS